MTDIKDTTENKKANDRGFDNMKVGSYFKERLASSSKSSSDSSQRSTEEHQSFDETQKNKENNALGKNNKSDKIKDKNTLHDNASEADVKTAALESTISTLVLSLSSAALMALGLATDPTQGTKEPKIDKPMAKFNIDMLIMLKEKTKGNLTSHEQKLIDFIISDLQIKYVEINSK